MKYSNPALILLAIFLNTELFGHARLRITGANGEIPRLIPRNNSDANKGGGANANELPCGRNSLERSTNPVVLVAGETIRFEIEETIDHPSIYEINFSPDGQNGFEENNLQTITEDSNRQANRDDPNRYEGTFVVPNQPCTQCTIQMIQRMNPGPNETTYKSCVDVTITTADSPPPDPPTGFQFNLEVKP